MSPPEEPPPFLGTWPRVYLLLGIYLAVVIAALALFTGAYAP